MDGNDRKRFILDTNVLLHEPLSIYSFKEHNVVIPMTVLEELDRIKDRQKDVSRDARVAIRALEDIFHDATPEQIVAGVPLGLKDDEASGTIAIISDRHLPEGYAIFTDDEADNRIINTALYLQKHNAEGMAVLVTKDINMRLKAKGAGLQNVEDYRSDQLVDDIRLLSKGFNHIEDSFWDRVGECDSETHGREVIHTVAEELLPGAHINQFLVDDTDDFAGRVLTKGEGKVRFVDLGRERMMGRKAWGIHPKNIYQAMALDALLDPHIDLVILTGPAGCGKTLLAMASALEMTIEKGIYDRVIVTRNTPEIAESIGFLPGTEEEKMAPWLAAITDTLEVLHKQDECMDGSLSYIMGKANIQFKSVNFMRGRSIQNTFVLLDECQNLTASQLKTIITRCGEGTKLVCSGNLAQIDSNYLTPVTSGLTYIVERFKDFEGSANIYLNGVVRSRLASFAEENL
ncbi:ribonuclease [Zobellella endophytica]|uniref:Ribonuclease n=1 Tax=Zobellella endophytica TaxID=2116700 RepID=A0A2P7QTN1_9GAMM|nr:PhoH family protein [Zobellella endophytica]PSJ41333.1 ribonuclease [Zobellella endophytica]